jgi:AraC-like DNA-binding protein
MVNNAQINGLIYASKSAPHEIDQCLPQRNALREGKIEIHALSQGHYPGVVVSPEVLPAVSSIGYFDAIGAQDWGTEMHRNEGIEICYMESGGSDMIIDDHCYPFPAGTLSITRPWQLHQLGVPHVGPGRFHWVIIDVAAYRPNQKWRWPEWLILNESERDQLAQRLRANENPIWTASKEIGEIFSKLASYVASDPPEAKASRILIMLNELLAAILDLMHADNVDLERGLNAPRKTVELFLRELTRAPSILEVQWTLQSMASYCGIGRSSFANYCHEITNTSPIDYLTRCRVEEAARRLVADPNTPITEIAFDVGYSSSQYFARKFREHHGMSPRQWRKQ